MALREPGEPLDFDPSDPIDMANQQAMQDLAARNDFTMRKAIDANPDAAPRFMKMADGTVVQVAPDRLSPDTLTHPAFGGSTTGGTAPFAGGGETVPPAPGNGGYGIAPNAGGIEPQREASASTVAKPLVEEASRPIDAVPAEVLPAAVPASPRPGAEGVSTADIERDNREYRRRQEEVRRQYADAAQLATEAATAKADLEVHQANEKARILQAEQNHQDQLEAQAAESAAVRKTAQDNARNVVSQLIERQQATAFDPDEYMKRLGAGGQIGSAIAVALGQFGATLNHSGNNAALAMIENDINRHIDGQKEAYNRGERGLSEARNDYRDLVARGLSEAQAEATLRAGSWARAQRQIDVMGAMYGGADARVRAQVLLAATQAKLAEQSDLAIQHAEAHAMQANAQMNQVREFNATMQRERDAKEAALGPKPMAGEQVEKIDSNINGMKALLGAAQKFHEATNDLVPGGNVLGQLSGAGATSQYQRLRENSAGAVAGIQDPAAKMNTSLIERAEHSLPDARYNGHAAGMSNFANQYELGRHNLLTRLQTAADEGRDTIPYQKQLDEMDRQARELGILPGGIKRREAAGGR